MVEQYLESRDYILAYMSAVIDDHIERAVAKRVLKRGALRRIEDFHCNSVRGEG